MVTILHGAWCLESIRILRILETLVPATDIRVVDVPFMGTTDVVVPTVIIGNRTLARPTEKELRSALLAS